VTSAPNAAAAASSSIVNPPVVVFFTDNGKGLGHVTRMLAVARRARGRFRPYFLTLSLGYQILRGQDIPAEFFPPYHHLGLTKGEWSPLLMERLAEVIAGTEARAVVVDHVTPPKTFGELRRQLSGVEMIWSRRGLWKPGTNRGAIDLEDAFDQVVEPGDLAAPIDIGSSTSNRTGIRSIEPVILLDPSGAMPRQEARRLLGLPDTGRALLLNLSAPDTASLVAMLEKVRDVVRSVSKGEQIQLFAPLHPLHDDSLASVEGVTFAPVYPVAEFLAAFDGAVSTAGYNSFHELMASGLPVTFVAHSQTNVDDQQRRARFAQLSGRGHWAPTIDAPDFNEAIRRMLRPQEAPIARDVTEVLGHPTGAEEFADLLAETVAKRMSEELCVPTPDRSEDGRRAIAATIAGGGRGVVVVDARRLSTDDLAEAANQATEALDAGFESTPIFLIGDASPRPLVDRGIAFESVISADEWGAIGGRSDYQSYVASRLQAAVSRYGASDMVVLQSGESLRAAVERTDGRPAALPVTQSPAGERRRVFSLTLPVRHPGQRRHLEIDVPSHLYVPRLLEQGGLADYEVSTLACWMTILGLDSPGAALDVGANVGLYAWLAATHSDRPVVAFEPVPELAEAIRSVAEANELQVQVELLALSDRNGTAELFLSDATDSSNSLLEGFRPSSRSIRVELLTVDSYVAANPSAVPHVLKIDTETTEPEVLSGARQTLEAHRPWLIVEVLAKRSEQRLTRALGGLGYHWYRIDADPPFERRTEIAGDPDHEHLNWLFAPQEPGEGFWGEFEDWQEALRSCVPGSV